MSTVNFPLTNDVLLKVFSKIENQEAVDFTRLACVCKQFRDVINTDTLWKGLSKNTVYKNSHKTAVILGEKLAKIVSTFPGKVAHAFFGTDCCAVVDMAKNFYVYDIKKSQEKGFKSEIDIWNYKIEKILPKLLTSEGDYSLALKLVHPINMMVDTRFSVYTYSSKDGSFKEIFKVISSQDIAYTTESIITWEDTTLKLCDYEGKVWKTIELPWKAASVKTINNCTLIEVSNKEGEKLRFGAQGKSEP